jgi:hypothetical protein
MSKAEKIEKRKPAKEFTRAQAEKALSTGALPPEAFLNMNSPLTKRDPKNPEGTTNHPNWHVLKKAWVLLGRPQPKLSDEDMLKFNALFRIKTVEKTENAPEVSNG